MSIIDFKINFHLIYFSLSATQRKVTKERSPHWEMI